MYKKIIVFICLLISQIAITNAASHVNQAQLDCAPELKRCLAKILQVPEARQLISTVQQGGPLRIAVDKTNLSKQFGALWDVGNRTIIVHLDPQIDEGDLIGSILFELHNASITAKLDHLDQLAASKGIDKESYVQAVERLEYYNSINASRIADKGIKSGIFPVTAHLPVYRSFEEHYRFQKIGGHSAWIARNYDYLRANS